MTFEQFAQAHGLIIRSITSHRWVITPTTDHPHSGNGRYKFLGDVGWVQNWATMDAPAMWRSEIKFTPTPQFVKAQKDEIAERRERAEKAMAKAGWIMHQTELKTHEYLKAKGFPDEMMPVWAADDGDKLVIAMRREGKIVGCQLISNEGEKKFLYGQTTKGATFTMDAKGIPIFCEGLATGLSIQSIMKANKMRYTIHVCFSAGNMKEVARQFTDGFVVADNDKSGTGERIAHDIGKPYWMSDTIGEDFNDYHLRVGTFKASQSLKKSLMSARNA
jgi:putative DNA primase/helicase